MSREQRCETCVHWARIRNRGKGDCRIRAPILIPGSDDTSWDQLVAARWPRTYSSDGCGEWQRDPDADAKLAQARAEELEAKQARAKFEAAIDARRAEDANTLGEGSHG